MTRPLAYISADFNGDELEARAIATKYCRAVYEAGYSPICPVLFQSLFLKSNKPQEYKDGRDMANELLRRSRIMVVCTDSYSNEMLEEIAMAKHYGIPSTTIDGIQRISMLGKLTKRTSCVAKELI